MVEHSLDPLPSYFNLVPKLFPILSSSVCVHNDVILEVEELGE